MEKKAISGPYSGASIATVLGAPALMGMAGGFTYGNLTAPSDKDLKLLQSKYVTAKLEQAVGELEQQKKLQLLKEKFSGRPDTLRI